MKVKPEQLASAVVAELAAYEQRTTDGIKQAVRETGKEARREIRAASPRRTGAYAKGWRVRTIFENASDIRLRVENPKRYQLTHLLEYGHQKAGGGRVGGKPHIRPARDRAEKRLVGRAKVVVRG